MYIHSEYPVSVVNPGAETGDTSGWTDETAGLLGVRTVSPSPASGSGTYYFLSGNSVNGLARQRHSLSTITGLATTEIDALTAAGSMWVRLDWIQSAFAANDPGGVGLRSLNSSSATISTVKSTEVFVPVYEWKSRSLSVLLPSGTRSIDILQHRTRTSGVNVDCYIDDIRAVVVTL